MIKRILVFWNPGAGHITAKKVERAVRILREEGFEVLLQATQRRRRSDGPCAAYIDGLRGQDAVLIAGGDGTISNVLNGLGDQLTIPFGIIPFGTVNLLSREIGVTSKNFYQPFKANKAQRAYLANLNGMRFVMTASVGFDAKSVAGLNLNLKKKIGVLAYIVSLLKTIKICRNDCYEVTCDNQTYLAKSVIVMNGRYYAGPYLLGYDTGIFTPNFQVYLLEKNSFFAILRYCFNMALQRLHKCDDIKVVSAHTVRIKSTDPHAPVQADGDIALTLPIEISTNHHPYMLLTP